MGRQASTYTITGVRTRPLGQPFVTVVRAASPERAVLELPSHLMVAAVFEGETTPVLPEQATTGDGRSALRPQSASKYDCARPLPGIHGLLADRRRRRRR